MVPQVAGGAFEGFGIVIELAQALVAFLAQESSNAPAPTRHFLARTTTVIMVDMKGATTTRLCRSAACTPTVLFSEHGVKLFEGQLEVAPQIGAPLGLCLPGGGGALHQAARAARSASMRRASIGS